MVWNIEEASVFFILTNFLEQFWENELVYLFPKFEFLILNFHPETIVSENIEESPGHFYSCHVFWSTDAAACLVTTYLIWIETLSQLVGKRQNMNSKNRGTIKMPGRCIKAMQRGLFLQRWDLSQPVCEKFCQWCKFLFLNTVFSRIHTLYLYI